jgi:hypothetical protein
LLDKALEDNHDLFGRVTLPIIPKEPGITMSSLLSILPESMIEMVYDLNCMRKLRQGKPTIIYQMGKVGSISIANSLKAAGVRPVFHTHYLNFNHISRVVRRLYNHVVVKSVPARIISLTREPFSRDVSSFFEMMKRKRITPDRNLSAFTVDELIELFFSKFDCTRTLTWFDSELKRSTGFDVYDHSLIGGEYSVGESENFDILVVKSELDNSRIAEIISHFMDMGRLSIRDSNITSMNRFAEVYQQFKDRIVYPREYVDRIVNSRYFRHFYETDRELILETLRIDDSGST